MPDGGRSSRSLPAAVSAPANCATCGEGRAAARPGRRRFHIRDAKTEAGVREVQMTPDLVEAIVEHIDRLRRAGAADGARRLRGAQPVRRPNEPPARGRIVGEAATPRDHGLSERGLPPLPNVTPHSLRRTYISIALLANNFDVKWVMTRSVTPTPR